MAISEKKMQIVIDNYFKSECNVDTSIRDAFEKGFRIGVQKTVHRPKGEWIPCSERLPSVSGTYIVTTVKGAVCLDHFYADSHEPHWSYWRTRTALCWMPLPKPYKGGDSE